MGLERALKVRAAGTRCPLAVTVSVLPSADATAVCLSLGFPIVSV
jgi:hypothetical protein